ncbi:hypothetical protein PZA11_004623 [Diplocarpon coronariae]|uniref:Adenylate cyclase n=1 Tax=Diplocarpon coronariae TaxID=2795749 RepID=A0A218YWX6_9HELO|nr:hypothetical protein JHW43_003695 [Diplocarpon mali]OWO99951.1 adenylate cyclase [Marssonina coronariae]
MVSLIERLRRIIPCLLKKESKGQKSKTSIEKENATNTPGNPPRKLIGCAKCWNWPDDSDMQRCDSVAGARYTNPIYDDIGMYYHPLVYCPVAYREYVLNRQTEDPGFTATIPGPFYYQR